MTLYAYTSPCVILGLALGDFAAGRSDRGWLMLGLDGWILAFVLLLHLTLTRPRSRR